MSVSEIMHKLLCAIFWGLLVTVSCAKDSRRIAGGKVATKDQFPFFAQLRIPSQRLNQTHFLVGACGGALIQPNRILAAAHCFRRLTIPIKELERNGYLLVYMGTNKPFGSDATINSIKKVHFHPNYVGKFLPDGTVIRLENDVAVAILWYRYTLTKYIQVIELPGANSSRCKRGTVVGIGYTSFKPIINPDNVMYVEIQSKTRAELQAKIPAPWTDTLFYSEVRWMYGHTLQGDSGGPFVCYEEGTAMQFGIVSTGRLTSIGTEISSYEDVEKHLYFISNLQSGAVPIIVGVFAFSVFVVNFIV